MTGVVTFSYANWIARYPEFTNVAANTAQLFFDEATLYCKNALNPVAEETTLAVLLNMVTAHVAALNTELGGCAKPSSSPVGRVSSATEGSVSASFTMDFKPGTPQWFQQTRYGSAYWAATAQYRTFKYRTPNRGLPLSQAPWLY